MIRLPPSIICLAASDLLDYNERRQQRELENVKKQFARFEAGAQDGPKFGRSRKSNTSQHDLPIRQSSAQGPSYPTFGGADSSEDQSGLSRVASPENITLDVQQPSSPPKDDFHYGGFVESPTDHSSPFTPDDISTPPHNLLPPINQGYRARTLPRSPLYFSHNASSSPERRPTSSLTPRVASRVVNHNTPGLIFSQPARRPNFRHQTNSFSFDSSERASAAYEQDRISSLSTSDTTSRPTQGVRLRDELRGSSLSSSQVSAEIAELQPPYSEESEELEEASTYLPPEPQRPGRIFIFSSPRLPLPAPFSTTSRNVSDADSLPSSPRIQSVALSERSLVTHGASLVRSPSRSPNPSTGLNTYEVVQEHMFASPPSSPEVILMNPLDGLNDSHRTSPARSPSTIPNHSTRMTDSGRPSPMQALRSGATRILSHYRPRSPRGNHRVDSLLSRYPQTPSRNLSVYNDGLPSATQPQTPAHLPESRHQSRYHPSYTAPVTRARSGLLSVPLRTPERRGRPPATPSRATRAVSPVGLQTGGFRGLYGGRENGDEEQNWVDGVRFDNAEVRLWGLRDAAADGRTLRDTPEREEWRFGRH